MPIRRKRRPPRKWPRAWPSGLKRLEAFRDVAQKLLDRPQLDRDIFSRGDPEPIAQIKHPQWSATLYDLLSAYAVQRQKQAAGNRVRFAARKVWSLAEAREAIERLVGVSADWTCLDDYLVSYLVEPAMVSTVKASSFAATLEMVREGVMDMQQHAAFAPLYVRKRAERSERKWPGRNAARGGETINRRP